MANKITRKDALPDYPSRHNTRERKLYETIRDDKNVKDTFAEALLISNMDNTDGSIYTGATGEVIAVHSSQEQYEVYQAAVATPAVVTPFRSADGLELKPVGVADALEIAGTKSWTVGEAPFYFKTTIKTDTIANVTEIFAGLRKQEAFAADPDNYDEMAAFNIGKDVNGQVEIHTILNNAATSESAAVGSALEDAGSTTLEIRVSETGRCSFYRDGTLSTAASFSFDDGEVVKPFIHLNAETGDPGVSISLWECGTLEDA